MGTASGLLGPAYVTTTSAGTQPWMRAPIPTPRRIQCHTFVKISRASRIVVSTRSCQVSVWPAATVAPTLMPKTDCSTQRSRLNREKIQPTVNEITAPASIYIPAMSQPNWAPIKIAAVSETSGEATRKVSVMESGIPAATKPIKSGIEEQEQNGVTSQEPRRVSVRLVVRRFLCCHSRKSGGRNSNEYVDRGRLPKRVASPRTAGWRGRRQPTEQVPKLVGRRG